MASKKYEEWVALNGPEPNIPGFLLTNEQLFWVALKLKLCVKTNKYFYGTNLYTRTEFRKVFNCSMDTYELGAYKSFWI